MPELPEVETLVRGLAPHLEGQRVKRLVLRRPNLRFPFPSGLAEALSGQRIVRLARRAKYGLVHMQSGDTLLFHLGMSGRMWVVPEDAQPERPHIHMATHMESSHVWGFEDPRRFGFVDWYPGEQSWQASPYLRDLGPEPLSNQLDATTFHARLSAKRASLKAALLDQRLIAGVGNIYASEALFQAGLYPTRLASSLSLKESERLLAAVRDVLQAAIEAGGSTLRDHRQVDGTLGYFQHSFRVYGREGEACVRCGGTIERFSQQGRATYACQACQS